MPRYCPRCGESLHGDSTTKGETRRTARKAYEPAKKKRGPSAYNKKYAAAYKRLKKKHPRSSFAALAKKAHRMVKKK
jgi:DNA-directed RNA polymerase subunit M/transcription elongation factor TFIIS